MKPGPRLRFAPSPGGARETPGDGIVLPADGRATYNLAVVADEHSKRGVLHAVRQVLEAADIASERRA